MSSVGEWIRFGIEELRFLRSPNDLKIFYDQKLPFLVSRITGRVIRETRVPPSLQIEPTNHRNLDCVCCSRRTMKRKEGFMDTKLFDQIVKDAAAVGVKRIHLYLHGEPLLHPQLIGMISYIKSHGMGITLATNGMLLDKDRTEAVLRAGMNSADYIQFSILGYLKETHETIMRGG